MAEAAKPLMSAASKVFPSARELPDFACGICCRQVTEQRILSCRHYFCAECIDSIRSTADVPACPYCREWISTPAICYPLILKDDEPQEEDIKKEITCEIHCQIEGCKRSVDFYCQPCKMFICYRCSKSSECIHSKDLHAAVEIKDLLSLTKEMFADWEKNKQREIEKLHSEISILANDVKKLVDADIGNARDNSQEMVQLTRRLHNLTVQKAGELVPLEYYRGNIDKISDTDLIQLVQHMSTDHSNRRKETADQYIYNTSLGKESSNIEEKVRREYPTSDQPEQLAARNETQVPQKNYASSDEQKGSSKTDHKTRSSPVYSRHFDDGEDTDSTVGYLPVVVEEHRNKSCNYARLNMRHERIRLATGIGYIEYDKITLLRCCACTAGGYGKTEIHYSKACQWNRTFDQESKMFHLIRRCHCWKPTGV